MSVFLCPRRRVVGLAALAGAALGGALAALLARRLGTEAPKPPSGKPSAQFGGTPARRYYTGTDLRRALTIADLRAMTHRRLPRFVLEYLEGGAENEATLRAERRAYSRWRFTPRTLVDVSSRSLESDVLGRPAVMPLVVAPTGLNGLFRAHGDVSLARGAAKAGVPFVQSTMSNDTVEAVAAAARGLRHWWQLYVFGGDEVWQELLRRADAAGCEALVLTTNAQIFGNREWQRRTQVGKRRLSAASALETLLHPGWLASVLLREGMPSFVNVLEFLPKDHRGFFESSAWIRDHQPESLSWDTVAAIRQRWKKPFLLKGILNVEDALKAVDAGLDGFVLSSHGGRQLDSTVAPLDLLPSIRDRIGDRFSVHLAGGVRRGTDILKALALGADAVWAGRAPLYGLCAGGELGVARALQILHTEASDALGLLGANRREDLDKRFLQFRA